MKRETNKNLANQDKMKSEVKTRIPLWVYPSTIDLMNRLIEYDNCKSPSEFIEKAIQFYSGYITEKDASLFLSRTLVSTMRGMLDDTENRMATLLFKLTVEVSVILRAKCN